MESFEPEKEPLEFEVDFGTVPDDLVLAIQTLKQAVEKHLFRWKKFPLRLPPPLLQLRDVRKSRTVSLRDVLVVPNPEEVVTRDAKGRPPRLDADQLLSIRELGEFQVESVAFPGQRHRWRLSGVLQSGRSRCRGHLMRHLGLALRLLVVTARNRLDGPFLSLRGAINALQRALFLLLDALVGLPSVSATLLSSRLKEERVKHLVAELTPEADLEQEFENLCLFVRYHIKKQTVEKCHINGERVPSVPYIYKTPKGQVMDLRLYNTEVVRQAVPFLSHVLARESRGWFPAFREAVVTQLRAKMLSDDLIEKQAQLAVQEEYLQRVLNAVRTDPALESLAPGLGTLLADQAHATVLLQRAADIVQHRASCCVAEEKRHLEEEHPILSSVGPWLRARLGAIEEQMAEEQALEAHSAALTLCRERGLVQAAYFLGRDLGFLREQAPALQAELARLRAPTRTFAWRMHVWRPSQWQVHRLSGSCPTDRPSYVLEKQTVRLTSTRWPFWRWGNYALRTFVHACNAMFLLGVVIPWCSPLSLRSLFLAQPFTSDYEVNPQDGSLQARKSSTTQTLCSRLQSLWRHISKARTRSQPGFVGLSGHANRAWNYMLKGVLGTLLLVLLFPACCLLTCAASITAALSAPLWMPFLTLLFHLLMLVTYDWDSPSPDRNRICVLGEALLWEGVVLGLLQPLAALLVAFVLCPIAAALLLLVAVVRWGVVSIWDTLLYHLVIRQRARLPLSDSWLVWRVSGPGHDHLYWVLSLQQALAALVAKLELEVLSAFQQQTEHRLLEPLRLYEQLVRTCFGPFAGTLSREHGPYKSLESELNNMVSALKAEVDKRKNELQPGLGVNVRSRTRMRADDLRAALQMGCTFVHKLLPVPWSEHIWRERGLQEKDLLGLTAQLFSEVFSPDLLVPLQDDDVAYRLEQAPDIELSTLSDMVRSNGVEMDVSRVMHAPKGKVHVHAPFLDLSVFIPQSSPSTSSAQCKRAPWKIRRAVRSPTELPPAVPHPAKIALIIFNRDNEDPIPLDSDACKQVLEAVGCGGCPTGVLASGTPSESSLHTEDVSLQPYGAAYTRARHSTSV